ncbi:hypothetical protein HH1059_23890 [Halorhodospira halochloris]|uniref:Tetratricopeptide repeat protein n=1 Tax=Halorhodospira halochloris TaxID=1052 RepID=A0A0X8X6B5_HALHR|nr:tetratricopeptide repeat protein [Halorhodospira halochloris]MBK1651029.1 hypothetical protein [Halorhodospira halochloris]MCG5547371.1 hypothetical protein [Halorhodospira halochloris]BAU56460.2 hypothetical protein HH1059_23890 [Halorhodospira halochloris]
MRKGVIALGIFGLVAATAAAYARLNADLVHFRVAEWIAPLGYTEIAGEHLGRSVELGLSHPDRLREAALELLRRDEADAAFAAIDRLCGQGELEPGLRAILAGHLDRLGHPDRARSLYDGAQLTPQGTMHYAELLRRADKHEAAIDLYRNLLQRLPPDDGAAPEFPSRADVRLAWAETLAWNGAYAHAEAVLAELLEQRPEHRPARLLRARVLAWGGNPDAAIEAYRHYLGDTP